MKKRINSKDMEVGHKVYLAIRETVPDDDVTIRQVLIGSELLIGECYAQILDGLPGGLVDAKLDELIEEHNERLDTLTKFCIVAEKKNRVVGGGEAGASDDEKEGVSDAEEELRAGAAAGGEA